MLSNFSQYVQAMHFIEKTEWECSDNLSRSQTSYLMEGSSECNPGWCDLLTHAQDDWFLRKYVGDWIKI